MRIRAQWLSAAALSIAATLAVAPTASAQRRHVPGPRPAAHATDRASEEHEVDVPPPAPPHVARPPRPFADAVWTDGYYRWNGRAHVWVDGAWVQPVPGRRWSPWRWEQSGRHWVLIPGGWVPSHQGHL